MLEELQLKKQKADGMKLQISSLSKKAELTPEQSERLKTFNSTLLTRAMTPKEQDQLEELSARNSVTHSAEYEKLKSAKDEEEIAYNEWVLDEGTGFPTKQGITYLLLALGVIKPQHTELLPTLSIVQGLIQDRKRQFASADPGSDRQKQLGDWLKGV